MAKCVFKRSLVLLIPARAGLFFCWNTLSSQPLRPGSRFKNLSWQVGWKRHTVHKYNHINIVHCLSIRHFAVWTRMGGKIWQSQFHVLVLLPWVWIEINQTKLLVRVWVPFYADDKANKIQVPQTCFWRVVQQGRFDHMMQKHKLSW